MSTPASVLPVVAALLMGLSGTATAQSPPPVETRLNWDQCAGDGYVGDRTFACDTNDGEETLVASLVLHDGARDDVVGFVVYVDVTATSAGIPDWWDFTFGSCHSRALSVTADPVPDTPGCRLVATPLAVSDPQYGTSQAPNRFFVTVAAAVPSSTPVALEPDVEYRLFAIRIQHAGSTGLGSCAGCTVPACLGIGRVDLEHADASQERFAGAGSNSVTWQGGYVADYPTQLHPPPYTGPYDNWLDCTLPPVPARNRTWGTIKTLYR